MRFCLVLGLGALGSKCGVLVSIHPPSSIAVKDQTHHHQEFFCLGALPSATLDRKTSHPFSTLLPTRSLVPGEVLNGCISTKSRDDLVVQQVRVLLLRCLRLRIPQIGSTCLSKGRTRGLLNLVLLFLLLQFSWVLVVLTTPCGCGPIPLLPL